MKLFVLPLLAALAAGNVRAGNAPGGLVLIEGGALKNSKSNYYRLGPTKSAGGAGGPIGSFYLGKYEVSQMEWSEVMGDNPSKFKGENLPVDSVSWYDCIEYCNKRSLKEGLQPYYTLDRDKKDPGNGNEIDDLKWVVTINEGANGYRLPTEEEWEYAAGGAQLSASHLYSGSDDIGRVAWYWTNSGDKPLSGFWSWPTIEANHNQTKPIGRKEPNELGLYDMSGNVREWCWNWYSEFPATGAGPKRSAGGRVWKGGGWMGGDFCCAISFRAGFEASGRGPDQGLRVCRDNKSSSE